MGRKHKKVMINTEAIACITEFVTAVGDQGQGGKV